MTVYIYTPHEVPSAAWHKVPAWHNAQRALFDTLLTMPNTRVLRLLPVVEGFFGASAFTDTPI